MSEERRGRRPPLQASSVAQATYVESPDGAPSIVREVENVPLAPVDGDQSHASRKGMIFLNIIYMYFIYNN